jgi:hypothetical protein
MDSDSGEQSEGEPVTAAGTGGPLGGLGRRGSRGRKSLVFLRAAGQEADPRQPDPFQAWTRDRLALVSLLRGFPSTPLHLGARQGEEARLRVALRAAGRPQLARVAGLGGGGEGFGKSARPVVCCREDCNTFAFASNFPSAGRVLDPGALGPLLQSR